MADLKELLGEAYKEGMTFDEASAAIKDRKIVDLSTGDYVGKRKYDDAVKERDEAIRTRDESAAKYKDYDDLVKYREESEKAKASSAMSERLGKLGVKADMVDFVKFQIESGKIEKGKKDEDLDGNVRKFLEVNPQYSEKGRVVNTQGKFSSVHVSTAGDGNEGQGEEGGIKTAKVVSQHPWNRSNRRV